jgi:hypothetical protein
MEELFKLKLGVGLRLGDALLLLGLLLGGFALVLDCFALFFGCDVFDAFEACLDEAERLVERKEDLAGSAREEEDLAGSERERAFNFDAGFFTTFASRDAAFDASLPDDLDLDREAFEDFEDLEDFDDAGDCFWRAFLDAGRSSARVFERPRAADGDRLPADAGTSRRAFLEEPASTEDERFDLDDVFFFDALLFEDDGGETTAPFAFLFDVDVVLATAAVVMARVGLALRFEGLGSFFLVDVVLTMMINKNYELLGWLDAVLLTATFLGAVSFVKQGKAR